MGNNDYDVGYIPPNFREGISVLGFMIRIPYVIQAVPFVAIIVIALLLVGDSLTTIMKIVIGVILCGIVVFVAMSGINGDSLFGFLGTVIRSRKQEKVYLYNPRVKTEIKPLQDDPGSVEMLPREKILMYMEKRRAGKDQKANYDTFEYSEMFFEDDEGQIEKPYAYMTPKERREYKRKQKTQK